MALNGHANVQVPIMYPYSKFVAAGDLISYNRFDLLLWQSSG